MYMYTCTYIIVIFLVSIRLYMYIYITIHVPGMLVKCVETINKQTQQTITHLTQSMLILIKLYKVAQ